MGWTFRLLTPAITFADQFFCRSYNIRVVPEIPHVRILILQPKKKSSLIITGTINSLSPQIYQELLTKIKNKKSMLCFLPLIPYNHQWLMSPCIHSQLIWKMKIIWMALISFPCLKYFIKCQISHWWLFFDQYPRTLGYHKKVELMRG